MPSAIILIADGTEEMEFTIAYDTLVRAGIKVTSAFVDDGSSGMKSTGAVHAAKGSRGINIVPDIYFESALTDPISYDLLVVPGGAKGADTMSKHLGVQELVKKYLDAGKYVGMICAGILAALSAGLPNQPLTSHPSVRSQLEKDFDYKEDPVVVSGHLVTSRGPGTAFPFALTLIELLCGKDQRNEVQRPMVFPPDTPW
ncbi:class I glutamine amidotransferase-like protein [Crepidotus variabilis]|uniref:D-lactate dehydratase n=1 Tax=Crepidotus variabilis TaxID=179855 RepID=A0A9P6EKZ3_9AGAR|nr:class I glutamine amidotransferase-like protein [Crepidotus variabilis]